MKVDIEILIVKSSSFLNISLRGLEFSFDMLFSKFKQVMSQIF